MLKVKCLEGFSGLGVEEWWYHGRLAPFSLDFTSGLQQ